MNNYLKAVLSGVLVWVMIFVLWTLMDLVPALYDNLTLEWIIAFVLSIPIVVLAASLHHKEHDMNGFLLGLIFVVVTIILDALITVPLLSAGEPLIYVEFFSDWVGGLWYAEILLITGIYEQIRHR